MRRRIATSALSAFASVAASTIAQVQAINILTIGRLVERTSTVPAIKGEKVGLFVGERIAASVLEAPPGKSFERKVLMVHGGFSPATLAFDVQYRDYSWIEHLARESFGVFTMHMTGYGRSTRPPQMDDPCNLLPAQQKEIVPKTLPQPCTPKYPFEFVNSTVRATISTRS